MGNCPRLGSPLGVPGDILGDVVAVGVGVGNGGTVEEAGGLILDLDEGPLSCLAVPPPRPGLREPKTFHTFDKLKFKKAVLHKYQV